LSSLQSAAEHQPSDLAGDAVRVLVVDDDSVLVRAIQRVLCVRGFEVDTALDGRSALERLDRQRYDVLLLDMQMANMDGMEVFRAVRERTSPPATIIHSAHIDVRTAVLATRAGVQEVMQKPVAEEILATRIRELAAERRAGHGATAKTLGPPKIPEALLRFVGGSGAANELREHIRRVAHFRDLSVLVQGPTGTGKELVAQAIHAVTCPSEPFVSVNCAAVPENLFESELFGHEAGAFTNAKACRLGLLEEAGRGTLFLDEIGEMPLPLQAKLLRVLEIRQFRRVGGNRTRVLSARIVSATNRSLTSALRTSMRADLFFRLAGYTIRTPSLAEHVSDIPELAQHFLDEFERRHHVGNNRLAASALAALTAYTWPGNVRELRGVIENACILARNGVIERREVEAALQARSEFSEPGFDSERALEVALQVAPFAATQTPPPLPPSVEPPSVEPSGLPRYGSLPALQRDVILRAFEDSKHNLTRAAVELGIPRSTLRARLRRYGVR
jgi:two-component system, NtrC family, response regulator AtoC